MIEIHHKGFNNLPPKTKTAVLKLAECAHESMKTKKYKFRLTTPIGISKVSALDKTPGYVEAKTLPGLRKKLTRIIGKLMS